MLKESLRLGKQIKRLKQDISKMPEGKIIHIHNAGYSQWYQSDGHTKKYIPKKKQELIEKLAIKKYLSYQLEDCENEKRAIEFYLRHHREDVGKAEKFLTDKSEYGKVLSPYFKTKSKELQEWLQEPFEQNPQYDENLIIKTISGNKVRSKSEVIIDTLENPLGAEEVMELIERYFDVETESDFIKLQFGE